eukprot:970935_1
MNTTVNAFTLVKRMSSHGVVTEIKNFTHFVFKYFYQNYQHHHNPFNKQYIFNTMGHQQSLDADTSTDDLPRMKSVTSTKSEITISSPKRMNSLRFESPRDSIRSSRVLCSPIDIKTMSSLSLHSEPPSKMSALTPSDGVTLPRSTSLPGHHRRKSSLLNVYNGITGKYISSRICKIAARFWKNNIDNMSVPEQLEIGCSIFFGMMSTNTQMKNVMQKNFKANKNIESTSLKYLDMMGWLMRHLATNSIDLHALLTKLGLIHLRMGITIVHYSPMLRAMHETFTYYFPQKYSIDVKYAMDEIFSLAAQLMTGAELKCNQHFHDIADQFQANDIPFLKNLDHCLKSQIGQDYLYRYLSQTWCDEMIIFLKALHRFKTLMTDKERFFVAREINKISIDPHATFALNLSYETRTKAMAQMVEMEDRFAAQQPLEICANGFYEQVCIRCVYPFEPQWHVAYTCDKVELEVYKLIMDNHWVKFVKGIKELQSKSFYLE